MEHVENIVEAQIELLTDAIAEHYQLESGDISPQMQQKLDACTQELTKVLIQFVKFNQ